MASFCKVVVFQKETAERDTERADFERRRRRRRHQTLTGLQAAREWGTE